MRILISSHCFSPSVGGIEYVSAILAEEFSARGHAVRLITATPGSPGVGIPYDVHRRPHARDLIRLIRWCDVYLQNNISLQTLWPAWLIRVPVVITHQTWIAQPNGTLDPRDRLKQLSLRAVTANVAISRAVAARLAVPSTIIPNPYRDDIFYPDPTVRRGRSLVFVGRLVSDKGCDVLLDALRELRNRHLSPDVTLVGSGPEEATLRDRVRNAGLSGQVRFTGVLTAGELRLELCKHAILVVPSSTSEPFGIVALEGAACGCFVIGSNRGGLPEAIGPSGATFPSGNAKALADVIAATLRNLDSQSYVRPKTTPHLAKHHRGAIADRYLRLLESAANA